MQKQRKKLNIKSKKHIGIKKKMKNRIKRQKSIHKFVVINHKMGITKRKKYNARVNCQNNKCKKI